MSWWTDPEKRSLWFVALMMLGVGAALAAGLAGPVATACGPYFPYWIVTDPRAPLAAKVLTFDAALDGRVETVSEDVYEAGAQMQGGAIPAELPDSYRHTLEVERREIAAALRAGGAPESTVRDALARVDRVRQALPYGAPPSSLPGTVPPESRALPEGLPEEMRLYLEGAVAFRLERPTEAAERFRAVLDLSPAERRRRSTWAAFMLGRLAAGEGDFETAQERFRQTRELAAAGFSDPLGLGFAALGRMGRIELDRGRYEEAIARYAEQHRAAAPGVDPVGAAAVNLRWAAGAALAAPPERLADLARDDLSRRVITAYLLAHDPRDAPPGPWLDALEAAGVALPEEGGALAWLAYQRGDFAAARRWVDRAAAEGGIENAGTLARWVHGKLLLRDGELGEGRAVLEAVGTPRATAEAGLVALTSEEFPAAAVLFYEAGYGPDTIYVAEQVLTLPELTSLNALSAPSVRDRATEPHPPWQPWAENPPELIARVAAHRLARAGRLAEAGRLYPGGEPLQLTWLREWLAEAEDTTRPARQRAVAYFHAAELMRSYGLAIRGTLLGPDWGLFDGQFDLGDLADLRAELGASAAELTRTRAARPTPDRRWHYRYVAADLAWKGAHLLPAGDPDAVHWLYTAGSWLAKDDPAAAARFYQALP